MIPLFCVAPGIYVDPGQVCAIEACRLNYPWIADGVEHAASLCIETRRQVLRVPFLTYEAACDTALEIEAARRPPRPTAEPIEAVLGRMPRPVAAATTDATEAA